MQKGLDRINGLSCPKVFQLLQRPWRAPDAARAAARGAQGLRRDSVEIIGKRNTIRRAHRAAAGRAAVRRWVGVGTCR